MRTKLDANDAPHYARLASVHLFTSVLLLFPIIWRLYTNVVDPDEKGNGANEADRGGGGCQE